jgi:hypothetical protein
VGIGNRILPLKHCVPGEILRAGEEEVVCDSKEFHLGSCLVAWEAPQLLPTPLGPSGSVCAYPHSPPVLPRCWQDACREDHLPRWMTAISMGRRNTGCFVVPSLLLCVSCRDGKFLECKVPNCERTRSFWSPLAWVYPGQLAFTWALVTS